MQRRSVVRRTVSVVAVMAMAIPLSGVVATAHEDSEAEEGPLELELRPAIVPVGGTVFLDAEYEAEGDDEAEESDDGTEEIEGSDDADEPDDGTDADESEDDTDASDDGTDESDGATDESDASSADGSAPTSQSVAFTVEWGDASDSEPMMVTETEHDGDEFEAEAEADHVYASEGTYTATVTATPDVGEPVTASVRVHVGQGSARLAGEDRLGTAIDISRDGFPEDGSASAVLLARDDHYADALAAASLALFEDGPVLLTRSADLAADVLDEIDRAMVAGGTVYLLGGEQALSPAIAASLDERGHPVVRIAGDDRVDTALQLAQFLVDANVEIEEVVIASATNFPDALAAAAFAATAEAPVLLTDPAQLDPRVGDFLAAHADTIEEVLIAGGPAAVSPEVEDELAARGFEVERFAGDDRFATAVEIAERLFPDATAVVIATGTSFPDALAGAAQAGRLEAPVLLVGDTLPEDVREYLEDRAGRITVVYTLGGDAAVPDAVLAEVNAILGLD